jgi:hypothetical protein
MERISQRGWRAAAAVLASIAGAAGLAAGQDTTLVAAGDAVRISAPAVGLHESEAVFVRVQRDTLVVRGRSNTTVTAIPLAAVTGFEVNHGNRPPVRQTLKGAFIGGSVGLLAGTIASSECPTFYGSGSCHSRFAAMMAGLGAGALVGAGIGSLIKVANYRTVKLARDASATMALSRRSVGVRVTIRM